MRSLSVLAPIALLALGVGFQMVPKQDKPHFMPPKPLSVVLPSDQYGWKSQDVPLGETEFVEGVVKNILRYDDSFYRVYRRGDMEVGVYAAYWNPRSIHPADAATHSPDLCWINAGWQEQSHDYAFATPDGRGGQLLDAQYRVFTAAEGKQRQEVLFWHLLGGRISGYAMGPSTRWRERVPVLIDNQLHNQFGRLQREQVFLRISTNKTIAEFLADPLWSKLTEALAPMGIEPSADSR